MPKKTQEKNEKMTNNFSKKSKIAEREEEILKFWQEKEIFQKTLEKNSPRGEYVFYDGPPFATGLPHFGHILAGTIKDAVCRYQTMLGKKVKRKWGWDCHGLPVENIVEKELGLKSRKDILDFGIERFNEVARKSVVQYVDDWKKIIPRTGRFVDMEDDYKTMSPSYSETIWWIFNKLNDKGLVSEGFKTMFLCPRCETTLSNFEVNQGYKDITDISVTVKFELVDEPGTFILAWTTTPWTLPGNVALAVGKDIEYVKIENKNDDGKGITYFILAKERLEKVFTGFEYKVLETFTGSKLVGKLYKPVFDYYNNDGLKNGKNGFKVYPADFVTVEDGTGVVHIAPAFGEDDLMLGKKNDLPFIQHVGTDGKFKKEVTDFAGEPVKPKEDHQKADVEIIKYLAKKNLLFSKEKIVHSYPHCWRCDTPLLNYASESWFVEVPKIKDKLIAENKKINWVPKEIGEGRFGEWLENTRDWAISRSRFWGAPMPVWRCTECKKTHFISSIQELKEKVGKKNDFFMIRHGEAESNILGILSTNIKTQNHLTELGKKQAKESVNKLKDKKIDLIFSSPFMRSKETAEIIAEGLDYPKEKIIIDDRLHEVLGGVFDGKTDGEYQAYFKTREEKFTKTPEGGENYTDIKKRMTEFLYDINSKHEGKKILIVSHNTPLWLMFVGMNGMTPEEAIKTRVQGTAFIENSEIKEFNFVPISHNRNYELDLHRPYIDEITFKCNCGGIAKRIPEVFDCWFESGSMPYAQNHYPFENLKDFDAEKNIGFPADFIAEGLDQTRGWFYSMLVVSTAVFGESSFKNVIVNGIVLTSEGQKMSKRLQNYTDPIEEMNKFGADAMRYYLLSSPVVKAEDFNFEDSGVDEVVKKIIMRLDNVFSFCEMYGGDLKGRVVDKTISTNVLDKWILARLKELANVMTDSMNKYELDRATRPIADFVDDISTWFLRRSRDRFKGENIQDKDVAISTTLYVLKEFSKLLAPFLPFFSESLYKKTAGVGQLESVHLENWPEDIANPLSNEERELISSMIETRKIVSFGLEARAKLGIKVRQPLLSVKIKSQIILQKNELSALVKDELNVKDVLFAELLSGEVELDATMTKELKEEGALRDIIRAIQELRKIKGLNPNDSCELVVSTEKVGKDFIDKNKEYILKATNIKNLSYTSQTESSEDAKKLSSDVADFSFKIS
jgi:isoleucyl-tRNA synthetase